MKILIVIPAIGTVYGGPSKSVLALAEQLCRLSCHVDIVTTHANGASPLNVPLQTWITGQSYRIQYFPYLDIGDYKLSIYLTHWLFQHIPDYDVIHTNAIFSYPVLPAYLACQLHRIPYVVTPHGMLEPWALSYKAQKKLFYYKLLEKPALQKAAAIQVLATPEAKNIRSLGITTPLALVPNGIDRQPFLPLADPELFYQKFPDVRQKTLILFLGRIDPKKGLDLLASAFAKVHAQFPNTHLIVAGPDNIGFLPSVQAYFTQAGCLNAVTFTGMLTGDTKYAALAAASIYVAPSYSEGFSMSVLEGMAAGLACVITAECNFPEAANAQAAYVVRANADDITKALVNCLSNPLEAKAMGNRARQFVFAHYTWEQIAQQMVKVYTAIVHKTTVPFLH
jgi:glycosyltransferase involved in cell wall biosynthesis